MFNLFSACGAEGMPFGAFRPPVVFKIFSACGAEGVNFGAFRPQSTCDVQDFLRLRRWRALWCLQTPMHRALNDCTLWPSSPKAQVVFIILSAAALVFRSKFSPPAALGTWKPSLPPVALETFPASGAEDPKKRHTEFSPPAAPIMDFNMNSDHFQLNFAQNLAFPDI